jgi:hypothetical protein
MRRKFHWVDVLNEQTSWGGRAGLTAWFANLVGRNVMRIDGAVEGFEEALTYMRTELTNIHFGRDVDLNWLDTQLKTVNLGLLHHQGAQDGPESQLPLFRVRVRGMQDADLLRAVKETLLVQFAEFIGSSLDQEQCSVRRCEGLVKDAGIAERYSSTADFAGSGHLRTTNSSLIGDNPLPYRNVSIDDEGAVAVPIENCAVDVADDEEYSGFGPRYASAVCNKYGRNSGRAPVSGMPDSSQSEGRLPEHLEKYWRDEIALLAAGSKNTEGWQRCANLFPAAGKSRFCSDSCRFATFQLVKQVEDSGDLGQKQRRYRRRQEKQQV